MPSLTIVSGPDQGAVFRFEQQIVIGRSGSSDFPLADSSVSRRHALLAQEGELWGVSDLQSANGTFVNNRRVSERTPLKHGDSLRVGAVVLNYEDASRPLTISSRNLRVEPPPDPVTPLVPPPEPSRARPVVPPVRPVSRSRPAPAPPPPISDNPDDSRVLIRLSTEQAAAVDTGSGHTLFGGGRTRVLESLAKIKSFVFDEPALLRFTVDELLKTLPQAERSVVMLWDAGQQRFAPAAWRDTTDKNATVQASQTLMRDVLESKEAVLIASAPTDDRYMHAASLQDVKVLSAICAPIMFQDDIFGVLQIDSTRGVEPFRKSDVALTLAIALEVGMALAYARLHSKLVEQQMVEHDLGLARKIQRHFLPLNPPDPPGYGFAVEYRPALAVGGDLYDFIELSGGLLAIAIGDVSGKGVSAALFAAKVLSDLRYLAAGETQPAKIMGRINRAMARGSDEGMFVTVGIAVLDPKTGSLTVCSAGHLLPLVRDRAGNVVELGKIGDKPLGIDEHAEYAEYVYEIEPGDSVIFFTDGVIEALNKENELFGDQRLIDTVAKAGGAASQLVDSIGGTVRAFIGSHPQSDDVTIVAFDRK